MGKKVRQLSFLGCVFVWENMFSFTQSLVGATPGLSPSFHQDILEENGMVSLGEKERESP